MTIKTYTQYREDVFSPARQVKARLQLKANILKVEYNAITEVAEVLVELNTLTGEQVAEMVEGELLETMPATIGRKNIREVVKYVIHVDRPAHIIYED